MSFWIICPQKICNKKKFADHNAHFGHFYRKGRENLIQLALETGISKNPHCEPTWILAEKLIIFSKVVN